MSYYNKAKFLSLSAKNKLKEKATEIHADIESANKDKSWYGNMKSFASQSGEVLESLKDKEKNLEDKISNSASGKYIGSKARSTLGYLSKLPVISITSDTVKARHGIDSLYEKLKANPEDPTAYVWLAEAMERVQRDMQLYVGIRSTFDPHYFVIRRAIKSVASLGKATDPVQIQLLKKAYDLSKRNLIKNSADAEALHNLARIYLIQKQYVEAINFSKLAIIADPENALPLITISRAYMDLEQFDNAKKAAQLAVSKGVLFGNKLLADLEIMDQSDDMMHDAEAYSNFLCLVSAEDKALYWGVAVQGVGIFEGIGKSQLKKITNRKNI